MSNRSYETLRFPSDACCSSPAVSPGMKSSVSMADLTQEHIRSVKQLMASQFYCHIVSKKQSESKKNLEFETLE